jgi:hypothetical protein
MLAPFQKLCASSRDAQSVGPTQHTGKLRVGLQMVSAALLGPGESDPGLFLIARPRGVLA